MGIINTNEYTIIKKHYLFFLMHVVKFFFTVLFAYLLYFLAITYQENVGSDIFLILASISFLILNYAFLRFILSLIIYYNDLIILLKDKIIILKSSLFMQDDLEIIDISKIMKIDVQCHGFFANLLGFGNLIIEQQRDELRILHFVPTPYKVFQILREKNAYINNPNNDLNFFKQNKNTL